MMILNIDEESGIIKLEKCCQGFLFVASELFKAEVFLYILPLCSKQLQNED